MKQRAEALVLSLGRRITQRAETRLHHKRSPLHIAWRLLCLPLIPFQDIIKYAVFAFASLHAAVRQEASLRPPIGFTRSGDRLLRFVPAGSDPLLTVAIAAPIPSSTYSSGSAAVSTPSLCGGVNVIATVLCSAVRLDELLSSSFSTTPLAV